MEQGLPTPQKHAVRQVPRRLEPGGLTCSSRGWLVHPMERGLPTPQKHAVRQVLRHTQNVSPDSAVSGVRTCISEQKQTLCFSRRALPFHYAQYEIHESIPHIVYISIPQSRHAPVTLNSTLFVNCQPLSRQLYSHAHSLSPTQNTPLSFSRYVWVSHGTIVYAGTGLILSQMDVFPHFEPPSNRVMSPA